MTASISPVLVSKPRPESGNSGVVKLRQPIDLATKSIDSVGVVVVVVVVMQVRGKGRRCVCVCVCRTSGSPKSRAWRLPTCIDYLPRQPAYCRRRRRRISSYLHSSAFSFFLSLLRDTHMICIRLPYQLPRLFQPVSARARKTFAHGLSGFPPPSTLEQAALVSRPSSTSLLLLPNWERLPSLVALHTRQRPREEWPLE